MFRLAIEKALNHMVNVNDINITRLDNSLVSLYVVLVSVGYDVRGITPGARP